MNSRDNDSGVPPPAPGYSSSDLSDEQDLAFTPLPGARQQAGNTVPQASPAFTSPSFGDQGNAGPSFGDPGYWSAGGAAQPAADQGPVTPGYTAPGYATPGYVNPGYATPGIVGPAYGQQGYGAAGFAPAGYPAPALRPCYACGRDWGVGRSCQYCRAVGGLPAGITLASPGKRLGGYVVELLLAIGTLLIGWLIWSLIVYGRGQTPAKQVLGMRVVSVTTSTPASWGTMFLREFILKGVVMGVVGSATFGVGYVVAYLWLLWDKDNQELWDKMLNTVVVNDPNKQLAPAR